MFARHVTMHLKPGVRQEAEKAVLSELLPLLNQCQGFRDVFLLISSDGLEAVGVTLWDSQQAADVYQRDSQAAVQRLTSRFAERPPELKTFDVSYTSTQKGDAHSAR